MLEKLKPSDTLELMHQQVVAQSFRGDPIQNGPFVEMMLYGVLGAVLKTALEAGVAAAVTQEIQASQDKRKEQQGHRMPALSERDDDINERPEAVTRKYRKLQQSFLALAIDKANYDPDAPSSSAPNTIAGMSQRIGLPAHPDTVRKQLKDAHEHAVTVKGYRQQG
ncbi:MAG: hypothetical protein ACKVRO_07545 [Micropepsaceae bacterium]